MDLHKWGIKSNQSCRSKLIRYNMIRFNVTVDTNKLHISIFQSWLCEKLHLPAHSGDITTITRCFWTGVFGGLSHLHQDDVHQSNQRSSGSTQDKAKQPVWPPVQQRESRSAPAAFHLWGCRAWFWFHNIRPGDSAGTDTDAAVLGYMIILYVLFSAQRMNSSRTWTHLQTIKTCFNKVLFRGVDFIFIQKF